MAALTNGFILGGYDIEWAHEGYFPFKATVGPIVGWASGVLSVPLLSATLAPSSFDFCDGATQTPIIASLENGINAPTNPPTYISNRPGPNRLPFVLTIAATKPSTLGVSAVEPNGALDLQGTTTAETTINLHLAGSAPQVCTQYQDNVITVGSKVVPEPPTGPPGVGLQYHPTPLTGPLAKATATLASNNFGIPAYHVGVTGCLIGLTFNDTLGGYDAKGNPYYVSTTNPALAAPAGWSQFEITATLTQLGIPVGTTFKL